MNYKEVVKRALPPVVVDVVQGIRQRWATPPVEKFLQEGAIPWAPGYYYYRRYFVGRALADSSLLASFREHGELPSGYGIGMDERGIELPWIFAHLDDAPGYLLDAGSALNHEYLLEHPYLGAKRLHVMTLAPENRSFWDRGISYIYDDLRNIPMRDNYYDTVVCISTLEHIGGDASYFTLDPTHREDNTDSFALAIQEMARVLKPGGQLFFTVPYGVDQDYGWFRQFDAARLARAIQAFGPAADTLQCYYRYYEQGWQVADATACATAEYAKGLAEWHWEPGTPRPPVPTEAGQSLRRTRSRVCTLDQAIT